MDRQLLLPRPLFARRFGRILGLLIAAGLAGCGDARAMPRQLPTASPTPDPAAGTESFPLPPLTTPTPLPLATAPPALVLPDESGTSVACAANTLRLPLADLTGDPTAPVSRIEADEESLYVLVDGGLIRLSRVGVDAGTPAPEAILLPGQTVAGRPVQELADLALDGRRGLLYMLDKAGHVFRYSLRDGSLSLAYRATFDRQAVVSPQLIAIAVDGDGRLLMLDSAYGMIWTPDGQTGRELVNDSSGMTESADLTAADGRIFVMRQDGSIRVVEERYGWRAWQGQEGRRLGLAIKTSNHLGVDLIVTVDALQREVLGMRPDDPGLAVTRHVFAFPDMGLLRDAAFAGGRLYALAGGDLFVYPGPAGEGGSGECRPLNPDLFARPTLYGEDVIATLEGMRFPIEEGTLPIWPRIYPGASRLYRLGVHHGLDLYSFNAPTGYGRGWPVIAPLEGRVARATIRYEGLSGEEFDRITADARTLGATPPDTMELLAGKHVVIEHEGDISTVYMHLDALAPGIVPGAHVRAGQLIGTVGVTGTEGEGRPGASLPHLHFEIWVGERYLGEGITIRETMWWYGQGFDRRG
ncbi:MAG TPA: M23 family metallopeptidase [Chloroflexi bacterium]|nr:M23 family metallopeptidase [Chloroflexota bacterium]